MIFHSTLHCNNVILCLLVVYEYYLVMGCLTMWTGMMICALLMFGVVMLCSEVFRVGVYCDVLLFGLTYYGCLIVVLGLCDFVWFMLVV